MGCWGIGGQWGTVEEGVALDTLRHALDLGINLFDTADAYGLGRSEELVGKAFRNDRDKVIVATKAGNWGRILGHPFSYAIREHVYACCDASLYRLKTDYIDLYQCHIGNLQDPDVFLEAFEILKERGKIRAYGISTDSLEVLQAFNRDGNCSSVQLAYNMLNRRAEESVLPYCLENNIGVLVRNPLVQGMLSGKFTPETTFSDSVRKGWNEGKGREDFLRELGRVEKLRFLADGRAGGGRTLAQAALQFILAHPAITCAIPGAKNIEQLESNAQAADGALSPDELEKARTAAAMAA
jgi:aryl-alcohol dehydrogenase-like predicted oxidoreductase